MKILFNRLFNNLALGLAVLLFTSPVYAQTSLLKNGMPERYIVQDSDNLWDIAGQFLNDPERWPEVWLPDPYLDKADFIYPGDELRISYVDGAPRILVLRGGREVEELGPEMREQALSSAIPAIPLEAIENSFTRNRIVSQTLLEDAPYIVSNIGDALAIATGDEVHARGE